MNKPKMIGRRNFVKMTVGGLASIPVIATSIARAEGEIPQLSEDGAQAVALGYKHSGDAVDTSKYPSFTKDQLCSGCALYQGEEGAEWGSCAIFPAKLVAADGWCSAYAAKPS